MTTGGGLCSQRVVCNYVTFPPAMIWLPDFPMTANTLLNFSTSDQDKFPEEGHNREKTVHIHARPETLEEKDD